MNQKLQAYIATISQVIHDLSEERKSILQEVIDYVQSSDHPKLHFICTHNSRRSHLSQVWAQTMAYHFGISVETFSGGTEATAFHPNAVAAIERAGFVVKGEASDNPRYEVSFAKNQPPLVCYSKRFDEAPNPTVDFAAVMTCSEADAECPVVFGATKRIKLFYQDPKVSDGTPEEQATYDARTRQIAKEQYYIFERVKNGGK